MAPPLGAAFQPQTRTQHDPRQPAGELCWAVFGEAVAWPRGLVQGIARIARIDAIAVGEMLFNREPADTACKDMATLHGLVRRWHDSDPHASRPSAERRGGFRRPRGCADNADDARLASEAPGSARGGGLAVGQRGRRCVAAAQVHAAASPAQRARVKSRSGLSQQRNAFRRRTRALSAGAARARNRRRRRWSG